MMNSDLSSFESSVDPIQLASSDQDSPFSTWLVNAHLHIIYLKSVEECVKFKTVRHDKG